MGGNYFGWWSKSSFSRETRTDPLRRLSLFQNLLIPEPGLMEIVRLNLLNL